MTTEWMNNPEAFSEEYEEWLKLVEESIPPEEPEDNLSDVEADSDTLASAGYGTDEDYGYFGGDEW